MKRIAIAVGIVVLAFGVAILAQQKSGSAEQELIDSEQGWANAQVQVKLDLAVLERILADDYTWINQEGVLRTKAQNLELIKSGGLVIPSMVTDDMKVRIYGDAAVVTGRNTFKATLEGKDINGQERWTDTWIKRNGRWQCVATHNSMITAK
jgi:ketosteroid isomerase-like protein